MKSFILSVCVLFCLASISSAAVIVRYAGPNRVVGVTVGAVETTTVVTAVPVQVAVPVDVMVSAAPAGFIVRERPRVIRSRVFTPTPTFIHARPAAVRTEWTTGFGRTRTTIIETR